MRPSSQWGGEGNLVVTLFSCFEKAREESYYKAVNYWAEGVT